MTSVTKPSQTVWLDAAGYYLAAPILGLIAGPPLSLGMADEFRLLRLSIFDSPSRERLAAALSESFKSFRYDDGVDITLRDPLLLIVRMNDDKEDTVRNVLLDGDMAMSLLQRKMIFGNPRYVAWNRRSGRSVGAIYQNGTWKPIVQAEEFATPAILKQTPKDFWDQLLSRYIRNGLTTELESALINNLTWERDSRSAADDTHRFVFTWIAIESVIVEGERSEGAFVRRLGLLAAAPRGADSKVIMADPQMNTVFQAHSNPHGKAWGAAIEEMYRYRCKIVHDGALANVSVEIDPMKVDWFYHLASFLNKRLQHLVADAITAGVPTLADFWNSYALPAMYSPTNRWVTNGTFVDKQNITFDWKTRRMPIF